MEKVKKSDRKKGILHNKTRVRALVRYKQIRTDYVFLEEKTIYVSLARCHDDACGLAWCYGF